MAVQIRDAQIEQYRKTCAARQRYVCPICRGTLAHVVNVLDHSHVNGNIRSTLCNSCNESEGKVLAGVLFRTPKSNLGYKDQKQWL